MKGKYYRISLIETLMLGGKHCCRHSFLTAIGVIGFEHLPRPLADRLARKIGVSWKTIYRWNALMRDGIHVPCEGCKKQTT